MKFNLSVSNIGWEGKDDARVYNFMRECQYSGLEIAPTRVFPEQPYEKLAEAGRWADELKRSYGFRISSMQSIWFGRQERIFGSAEERDRLLAYTKKAIAFAERTGCGNIVFGCPRNRVLLDGADAFLAVAFFKELGDYAAARHTVIGMEANPPIYNTNYVNDTASALHLIEQVDSKGFRLNLDIGTMLQNGETAEELVGRVDLINHVHISEPGLKPIKERRLHGELRDILEKEGYRGFISIEMAKCDTLAGLEAAIGYVKGVFGG